MFTYCLNNPINNYDPTGTDCICLHRHVRAGHVCNDDTKQFVVDTSKYRKNTPSSIGINDFKNKDGSYSLYDNQRNNPDNLFHEQILSGKVSKPSISLKDGTATLGSVSATLMTGGWEFKHVDLSLLDICHAKLSAGINNGELDITAMVSAWTPSTTIKIWDVSITISAHVGSIGGKFHVGSGKFDIGAAYGYGASISVNW